MNEQVGWRGMGERLRKEAPRYAQLLPELPRLLHDALKVRASHTEQLALLALLSEQRKTNRLLQGVIWAGGGFLLGLVATQIALRFL